MPTFPVSPLINGKTHSWSSIRVGIEGVQLVGIQGINYTDSQVIEPVYGVGNAPIAQGEGPITYEGSITLLAPEVEALAVASPNGRIQDIPAFDVVVKYRTGLLIHTHTLVNCRFMTNERNVSQGDTSIPVELPLFIGAIRWR
jgi:hypothetical protein